MPYETSARGTQREPNRHFTLADARASKHQVSEVCARDEQHKSCDAQKKEKRTVIVPQRTNTCGSGVGSEAKVFVSFRPVRVAAGWDRFFENAGAKCIHFGRGALQCHTWLQTAHYRDLEDVPP